MKNKIIQYFKNNYTYIIIVLIWILFLGINSFDILNNENYETNLVYKYLFFSSLLLVMTIIIFRIVMKKKGNLHLPKLFLIIGSILGIVYVFISPLFTGSDEQNHYYRIYEVSEGIITSGINSEEKYVGSMMPSSLAETYEIVGDNTKIKYKDISEMAKIKLDKKNKIMYGKIVTKEYSNTALYSPISYAPHVVGFWVGKVFNSSPYIIGVLGRIFNLFFYLVLGYISIRIIPKYKLFYFLVLLSPNMLQCATTLSADAFTNVIVLLYISLFLKIYDSKEKINKKEQIFLYMLSIIIALCKIVYLPIVGLLVFIPKNRYKSKKSYYIYNVITLLSSAIISVLWLKNSGEILNLLYTNSHLQKEFIFSNIIEYLFIIIRTFIVFGFNYIECLFVGTTMYHSQVSIPTIISLVYIIIIIFSLFNESKDNNIKVFEKIIIGLIGLCIMGLIATAIYIQSSAQFRGVATNVVYGVQGRYFIPVVLLIPLLVKLKKNHKEIINEKNQLYIMLLINLVTMLYIVQNFIV